MLVRNCSITGNHVTNFQGCGGGIMVNAPNNRAQVAILNCTIETNEVAGEDSCGGGVHIETDVSSAVHLISSTVADNAARYRGGGVSTGMLAYPTDVLLVNSLVTANSTEDDGGGLYNQAADLQIINCTFSDNVSFADGGGYFEVQSGTGDNASSVINSIFWENSAAGSGHEIYNDGLLTIDYSIVEGGCTDIAGVEPGYAGTNFDVDPRFVDPLLGDYRLMGGSPAIDRGDNDAPPDDFFDVDEDETTGEDTPDRDLEDRIVEAAQPVVDRGAFEKADCFCLSDLNGDEVVGTSDLLTLLAGCGDCPTLPQDGCQSEPDLCLADINRNGAVTYTDLLPLLAAWGACPCSGAPAPEPLEDCLKIMT